MRSAQPPLSASHRDLGDARFHARESDIGLAGNERILRGQQLDLR